MTVIKYSKEEEEANVERRKEIDQKLKKGEALTAEETWMAGDQYYLDALPENPILWDMYYRRLYLHIMDAKGPNFGTLKGEHEYNFQMLVGQWPEILAGNYPAGSIMAATKKETSKELKFLDAKWNADPNISNEEKDEDLFLLYAWSKFRHVLVRRIFELDVKANYYVLTLNGEAIHYDCESVMHILSRHFAHGMKPYESAKDHFYGVFRHDRLHLDIEHIFSKIDAFGAYVNDDISDLSIRYKGELYKMYNHPVDAVMRISTFFPISSQKLLEALANNYSEVSINDELSVFINID